MALHEGSQDTRSAYVCRNGRKQNSPTKGTVHHERELARRHKRGDRRARDQLIERLLPLAQRLASRYRRPGVSGEDLVQVASVGLVKAVDRFDPDHGTAISSYAVPTILGEIKRHFRDTTWSLHVARDIQERVLKVGHVRDSLSSKLGRSPTPAEIGEETGDSTEDVLEAMEAASAYDSVSLESSLENDGDNEPFANHLGVADKRFEFIDETSSISSHLRSVPAAEQRVLALRFIHDMTQTQIAERMGVSQMHICRLIRRALDRIHAGRKSELEDLRVDAA